MHRLVFLGLLVGLSACDSLGADDCCVRFDACQQKLLICEIRAADPTDPIWLGDVPLFDEEDSDVTQPSDQP